MDINLLNMSDIIINARNDIIINLYIKHNTVNDIVSAYKVYRTNVE